MGPLCKALSGASTHRLTLGLPSHGEKTPLMLARWQTAGSPLVTIHPGDKAKEHSGVQKDWHQCTNTSYSSSLASTISRKCLVLYVLGVLIIFIPDCYTYKTNVLYFEVKHIFLHNSDSTDCNHIHKLFAFGNIFWMKCVLVGYD